MASLAQALKEMTFEDGSPDVTRRRSELDGLLGALLPNEIRHVKNVLSATTFIVDMIPRLPIEIILLIINHIDSLNDLKNMQKVSKTWQKIWTLEPVCDKLMKRDFRSIFRNTYQQLSQEEKCSAFVILSEQLRTMRNGEYHSMKIYKYSELDYLKEDDPTCVLNRQYRNGRVAWVAGAAINVYSLRTGIIKVYMTPARTDIQMWVLCDDVLIFMEHGRVLKLYAHSLCRTQDHSPHSITVPGPISQITAAQGHRVGVVTTANEVFIWDITIDRIKQFETTVNPIPSHGGPREVRILLPPGHQDILYVCTVARMGTGQEEANSSGIVKWAIQKYLYGKLVKTSYTELPWEGLGYSARANATHTLTPTIQEIDDDGNFNICQLPLDFPSAWTDIGCDHRWHRHRRPGEEQRQIIMQIAFNICDDSFSTKFYHLPGGQKHSDDINFTTPNLNISTSPHLTGLYHYWASNIYLPVIKIRNSKALSHDSPSRIPVKNALLVAIKSCDQIKGFPTDVNYMGGYGPEGSLKKLWTSKGRYPSHDLGLSHCLVGSIELSQQPKLSTPLDEFTIPSDNHTRKVAGDGSFLVLFGNFDFVVWSFNKSISLPDLG